MIRPMRSALAILALVATLSACHSQQKAGHGEVSGQILPGSVSDAMLPYDAVKSRAPLAPREATDQADNAGGGDTGDSAGTAAASGDSAVPANAASPAAAASAAVN